jgi:hypothetical protein
MGVVASLCDVEIRRKKQNTRVRVTEQSGSVKSHRQHTSTFSEYQTTPSSNTNHQCVDMLMISHFWAELGLLMLSTVQCLNFLARCFHFGSSIDSCVQ